MLKSHFNLVPAEEELTTKEEVEEREDNVAVTPEAVLEEEKIIYPEIPERKLHKSEISVRLSMLGKTADGDGYTYLKATCTGMDLTDITAIKSFKHLQFVDVSNNSLCLDALQAVTELPYLVLIHADKNKLQSAALKRMKYLQVIIMNNNEITSVHDVFQPVLSTLEVGNNRIDKIHFDNRMPTIRCLDFRYNLIQDLLDMDFPNLDSLYLAGNMITKLIGIEKLVNLRILHVRNNPIKLLDGFDEALKKLQYINLRNCKVVTLKQVKKLRCLPGLQTLILKGCPYMGGTGEEDAEIGNEEEDPNLRIEVLASLPRLKRINKSVISSEERDEANELMKQWLEEGENDEEIEDEQNAEEHNLED